MIELPLIFLGGLLGSAHCVGMCGGFALLVGLRGRGALHGLATQLVYTSGRVFTYGTLGAVAGTFGSGIAQTGREWVNIPALLSLIAGGILIAQGLASLGWRVIPQGTLTQHISGCLPLASFRGLLRTPGQLNVFLAGMITGWLPCGLVYGFLALAASTGDWLHGGLVMVLFGLGTLPLMVLTGLGGMLLNTANRRRVLGIAAVCVLVTGTLTLARGFAFIGSPAAETTRTCPFCATH